MKLYDQSQRRKLEFSLAIRAFMIYIIIVRRLTSPLTEKGAVLCGSLPSAVNSAAAAESWESACPICWAGTIMTGRSSPALRTSRGWIWPLWIKCCSRASGAPRRSRFSAASPCRCIPPSGHPCWSRKSRSLSGSAAPERTASWWAEMRMCICGRKSPSPSLSAHPWTPRWSAAAPGRPRTRS